MTSTKPLNSGPVALVTGASGGIGAACVRRFLQAGWRISATALAGPDLNALSGSNVLIVPGDITSDLTRREIIDRTLACYNRIDVLVNNAGVGLYDVPSSVSIELSRRLFEVNVFAPLAMAQLVIPVMRNLGSGTIVNIGSVGGYSSLPWAPTYCASKFASRALNDALRRELRKDQIHVVSISPGIVDTGFRENVLGGVAPPQVISIRRAVSADRVARAVLDGIKKRRRTVHVPHLAYWFRLVEILSPRVIDWYAERLMTDGATPAASGKTGHAPDFQAATKGPRDPRNARAEQ